MAVSPLHNDTPAATPVTMGEPPTPHPVLILHPPTSEWILRTRGGQMRIGPPDFPFPPLVVYGPIGNFATPRQVAGLRADLN
ncbi:hypothetical protein EYF80_039768 [Liparis tanakae]|uniref:Uncharacterized protein n=1 Tax=Liparis tanakae TaxID=230148 RepID=A0A4Z2G908_9TELE|nr:hypothetical protein EYF80_039768 [Liparis tanakae]